MSNVPQDVINAAIKVSQWFSVRNIDDWELGGCASRQSLEKLRAQRCNAEPVAWQYRVYYKEEIDPGWGLWSDCTKNVYESILESIANGNLNTQVRELYTAPPDAGFAAGMMKAAEICGAFGTENGMPSEENKNNVYMAAGAFACEQEILSAIPAESKAALRDTAIVDYLESLGQGFRVTVDLDATYDGEKKIRLSVNRGGVNDPELEPVAEGSSLRAIVNSVLEGNDE